MARVALELTGPRRLIGLAETVGLTWFIRLIGPQGAMRPARLIGRAGPQAHRDRSAQGSVGPGRLIGPHVP